MARSCLSGGSRRRVIVSALAAAVVLPALALTSQAANTPVFRNNNVGGGSTLSASHDVDKVAGAPAPTLSPMPAAGTIPGTAALLSPWGGGGATITVAGGSSKAKGGAGHTEGSNLAKITWPSGAGLDQIDGAPHDVNPSRYQIDFNYRWDLSNPGTFGPPMSGTFTVPVGAKVGTGPGAYARFEWNVHWDAVITGLGTVSDVRSPFIGALNFTGAGTYVASATAPASAFSVPSIAGAAGNQVIVRGFVAFEANNDDSRTVIEMLGSKLDNLDDELRQDLSFLQQYNDPAHPEFRLDATSGFEEAIPEPSSALLGAAGMALLLRRRRR